MSPRQARREIVFAALQSIGRPADAHEIGRVIGSDYNATAGQLRLLLAEGRVQQKRRGIVDGLPAASLWRIKPVVNKNIHGTPLLGQGVPETGDKIAS